MDQSSLYTGFKTHPSGWSMGTHFHPHYEVSAVVLGSGTFTIYDRSYPIKEGNIIVIPPNVTHDFNSTSLIRFAVLQVDNLPAELQDIFRQMTREHRTFLLSLAHNELEQYISLFNNWVNTTVQPSINFNRLMKVWVELLLLFIVDSVEKRCESTSLAHVADYIRFNYDKEIRVSELAKMVNMSQNGFRYAFRKLFGQSPKQYLQNNRLSQAKLLLSSTDKPIQQIAQQVGFPNIHAFSAWFQQIENRSPSVFRKLHVPRAEKFMFISD